MTLELKVGWWNCSDGVCRQALRTLDGKWVTIDSIWQFTRQFTWLLPSGESPSGKWRLTEYLDVPAGEDGWTWQPTGPKVLREWIGKFGCRYRLMDCPRAENNIESKLSSKITWSKWGFDGVGTHWESLSASLTEVHPGTDTPLVAEPAKPPAEKSPTDWGEWLHRKLWAGDCDFTQCWERLSTVAQDRRRKLGEEIISAVAPEREARIKELEDANRRLVAVCARYSESLRDFMDYTEKLLEKKVT